MRDGIALAHRRVPAVALVTRDFWAQGNFVAKATGMPEVPRVMLPHPVAGTGEAAMGNVAKTIAPSIVAALRGEVKGEVPLPASPPSA